MLERLGARTPIIQAPMAGVSTPELAATVSEAGAVGSIALGAAGAGEARRMIEEVRRRTARVFNVNVFCHAAPAGDRRREAAWIEALRPTFARFRADPPERLEETHPSFERNPDMVQTLLDLRPPVVSFHFGLPSPRIVRALKSEGVILWATATNLEEGLIVQSAGLDAVIAQGIEAGGHRGVFDPDADDDAMTTVALTRMLARKLNIPVIAAGGIMDGYGVAAALALGAVAAQMGTAFVACPESSASPEHRASLTGAGARGTRLTRVVSGRPARIVAGRFTELEASLGSVRPPDYPLAYQLGKALHAAAAAAGEPGYGAHWAGQGAPSARAAPAAELIATLTRELEAALTASGRTLGGASTGA